MISVAKQIIQGLVVHQFALDKNLQTYAPFSITENILIEAVKKGANRQELHEVLRTHAMQAWEDIQAGRENSLIRRLQEEKVLLNYLSSNEIQQLLDVSTHTGIAAKRAKEIVKEKAKLSIWLSQHVD